MRNIASVSDLRTPSHDRTAGAAAVQISPVESTRASRLLGTESSYKSEQMALNLIVREVSKSDSPFGSIDGIIRIFSDSKSNLDELRGGIVEGSKEG